MSFTTLVDTEKLAAHVGDPDWVVFDCRFVLSDAGAGERAYCEGHIAGAYYAHLNDDLSSPITPTSGRHPLPDPKVLTDKLGRWGADQSKQVIVYDDKSGAIAARFWWLLRWLGHEKVALLDGGLNAWQHEGHVVTTEVPEIVATLFQPHLDNGLWVNTDFIEQFVKQGGSLLVDARDAARFRGDVEPIDSVAGHIPGSVNHPFQANLDRHGCFLPPEDLRRQFAGVFNDIKPERVVCSCGSGVTACHNILAMEHAGIHGAKLYVGSWSEWIRDSNRPVATGA